MSIWSFVIMFIDDMQVTVWNGHCPVHAEPVLFDCFYGLAYHKTYLQSLVQISVVFEISLAVKACR